MTAPTVGGDLSHTQRDVMSWNPTDPPITIEQMLERDKLIPLDAAREVLATTEPLAFTNFDTGEGVRFRLAEDWNDRLAELTPTDEVDAFVTFQDGSEGAHEYRLTVDAMYQAARIVGMNKGMVERNPGHLSEDILNWYFRTGLDRHLQLMVVGQDQIGHAFTNDSVSPFSNLALLDTALEVVHQRFGDTPVYVDRNKLTHSLRLTHLQLVLPEVARLIEGTGEVDDRWWGGMQFTNSMTAEAQTQVEAFMFRQRCTNGYIDTIGDRGRWSRKSGGQDEASVLAWAREAVDEALSGFDGIFERVQSLVGIRLDPNTVRDTALDLFERYRIPQGARTRIIENLVETDQLNMYGLTNAVTQAANGAIGHAEQQRLLRAGGDMIRHADRCGSCHRVLPDGTHEH